MGSKEDLRAFTTVSHMSVALDETLDKTMRHASSREKALQDLHAIVGSCKATAVVVKPSLLRWGPSFAISIAESFADFAKQHPELPAIKVKNHMSMQRNFALLEWLFPQIFNFLY